MYDYDRIRLKFPLVFMVNTSELSGAKTTRHEYYSVLKELHYVNWTDDLKGTSWRGEFMGCEIAIRPWDMETPGTALNVFFQEQHHKEALAFKLTYC